MKVYRKIEEIGEIRNAVVTTGSFDGVHVGHKVIINRLKTLAKSIGGESVLITFHPHPRKVLYPDTAGKDLKLINSQKEKIHLLRKAGLDNLIIIPFTLEFSKTTSQEFVEHILLGRLKAKIIIVGFNHHFGHNREGDYQYLLELQKRYDFQVEEISQQDIENECVSSTRIRKALDEGKIQRANAYLDHQFIVMGEVIELNRYRFDGVESYTIQIDEDVKLIPPKGIYAISVVCDNWYEKGIAMVLQDKSAPHGKIIVFYLLNDSSIEHQQSATLFFHKQMRDIEMFHTNEDIINEMEKAKKEVEELIY